MFGYLRPFKDELKYKYIKEYKKYYCGVCNGLKKEFGSIFSVFLNYEMVYLYIFLEGITCDKQTEECTLKCYFNPWYKSKMAINGNLLEYVCFINYYLAIRKIWDNYLDEKNILYKWLYVFLTNRKKYLEKSLKYFEVKETLEKEMDSFYAKEKEQEVCFDELAVVMGHILEDIVVYYMNQENIGTKNERELAAKLNFQLGEYIYLLDALEDYEDDLETGKYNPLFRDKTIRNSGNKKRDFEQGVIIGNLMIRKIKSLCQETKFYFHKSILTNILEISLEHEFRQIIEKNYTS